MRYLTALALILASAALGFAQDEGGGAGTDAVVKGTKVYVWENRKLTTFVVGADGFVTIQVHGQSNRVKVLDMDPAAARAALYPAPAIKVTVVKTVDGIPPDPVRAIKNGDTLLVAVGAVQSTGVVGVHAVAGQPAAQKNDGVLDFEISPDRTTSIQAAGSLTDPKAPLAISVADLAAAIKKAWIAAQPYQIFVEPELYPTMPVYINVQGRVETYTIGEDGSVVLPVFGRFDAAGKTPPELENEISERWKAERVKQQPTYTAQIVKAADNKPITPDKQIKEGDTLRVTVNNFAYDLVVQTDGSIDVQDVGSVAVGDMRVDQLPKLLGDQWMSSQLVRVFVEAITPWVRHKGEWWLWVFVVLVAETMVILLLMRTGGRYRKWIIAPLVFVAGLFYTLEFFLPANSGGTGPHVGMNFLTPYITSFIGPFANSSGGVLLGVGVYSLIHVHGGRLRKRQKDWPFSLLLFVCMIVMFVVVLLYRTPDNPATAWPWVQTAHKFLFDNLYTSMDAAMFSMIAFFIMSAAYRSFRMRSIEASILMLAALIVFLGMLPIGQLLTQGISSSSIAANLKLENLSQWLLMTVNTSALRAVMFGIAVGGLAMSLRIWLGIERGLLYD